MTALTATPVATRQPIPADALRVAFARTLAVLALVIVNLAIVLALTGVAAPAADGTAPVQAPFPWSAPVVAPAPIQARVEAPVPAPAPELR